MPSVLSVIVLLFVRATANDHRNVDPRRQTPGKLPNNYWTIAASRDFTKRGSSGDHRLRLPATDCRKRLLKNCRTTTRESLLKRTTSYGSSRQTAEKDPLHCLLTPPLKTFLHSFQTVRLVVYTIQPMDTSFLLKLIEVSVSFYRKASTPKRKDAYLLPTLRSFSDG
jgi:hypothetical protein